MPAYNWEGRTRQGTTKKGVIEASSEAAVMTQLRAQMIMPVSVKAKSKDILENIQIFKPRVTTRDLVVFTRQFATMIDAGLPLVQCLDILADQNPNATMKDTLRAIKNDVEQGATFADALEKQPKVFDHLYTNLVRAGEVGGILDTILNRLAIYLEKADSLKRKVKGAMVYPTTVLLVAFGVISLLLIKVIPVFQKMFDDFGGALPGPTQTVIQISEFMQEWILVMIGVAIAVIMLFLQARKRFPKFHYHTDAFFLKTPVFGSLLRKVAVSRFTRTLGTMVSSGVPILDALEICAKTAGNLVIETSIMRTRTAISEGRTMAEPLEAEGVFPGMVVQMIAVGESTGAMDTMLSKIADFYDEEVDNAVDALTALLEPLMMVFLGGAIGGILIAMYLPIFKIAESIG